MDNQGSISRNSIKKIFTRDLTLGFLAYLAFLTAMSAIFPTFPIFLARLGSGEREIGVLVGILSVSSLVSRFLAGGAITRYSEKGVMMFGALLFTLTFLAFIVLHPFWPFFAVRLLQGVAVACLDTAAFALMIKTIPLAYRGQGIGYLMLAAPLSLAVVPSFSISLINQYSFTVLFLSCAALSLCSLFLSWKVKEQETVHPDKDTPSHNAHFLEWKIIPRYNKFPVLRSLGSRHGLSSPVCDSVWRKEPRALFFRCCDNDDHRPSLGIGEALSINISDIDRLNKEVRVIGKGSKPRTLFLRDETLYWIEQVPFDKKRR